MNRQLVSPAATRSPVCWTTTPSKPQVPPLNGSRSAARQFQISNCRFSICHFLAFRRRKLLLPRLIWQAGLASLTLFVPVPSDAAEGAGYPADLRAAQQALDGGKPQESLQLLQRHIPAAGAPDPRGFEWRLLWRRSHGRPTVAQAEERDTTSGLAPRSIDLRIFILPDNKTLAATTPGPALKFFDLTTLEPIREIMAAKEALHLTPDGKTLMTSGDGGLQMWDVRAKALGPMWIFPRSGGWAVSAFCPTDWIAAVHAGGGQVQLIDVGSSKPDKEIATFQAHSGTVRALAFSPDGATLASGGADRVVKLWDWAKQRSDTTLSKHTEAITTLAYAPDGKTLASGSLDKTIVLWDVASKQVSKTLEGHQQTVWALAYAPDGKTLASASADNTVRLWHAASSQEVATLKAQEGAAVAPDKAVLKIVFSPDGNTLAARLADGTLRVWRAASKEEIAAASPAK